MSAPIIKCGIAGCSRLFWAVVACSVLLRLVLNRYFFTNDGANQSTNLQWVRGNGLTKKLYLSIEKFRPKVKQMMTDNYNDCFSMFINF